MIIREAAHDEAEGDTMLHVYEFELFEDEGWYLAVPFDMLGGTQGKTYDDCCKMAADWLRTEMEYRAMHDEGFPVPTFGNEPKHGGRVVVFAVMAGKDTVRKVTAAEAARMLGVSPGRVTQMLSANLLEGWREGHRTWVTVDSVEARLAERPSAGRPRKTAQAAR